MCVCACVRAAEARVTPPHIYPQYRILRNNNWIKPYRLEYCVCIMLALGVLLMVVPYGGNKKISGTLPIGHVRACAYLVVTPPPSEKLKKSVRHVADLHYLRRSVYPVLWLTSIPPSRDHIPGYAQARPPSICSSQVRLLISMNCIYLISAWISENRNNRTSSDLPGPSLKLFRGAIVQEGRIVGHNKQHEP